MPALKLKVPDREGRTLTASKTGGNVSLIHTSAYAAGDWIVLETDTAGLFCVVRFEDSMLPAPIYVKGTAADYHIPPEDNRIDMCK